VDVGIACQQGKTKDQCCGANEAVKRVAVDADLIGDEDLLGRQVQWLVGGIAEEIVEKRTDRPVEADANRASEETAFPYDSSRHVKDRLATLASFEMFGSSTAEVPTSGGVEQ